MSDPLLALLLLVLVLMPVLAPLARLARVGGPYVPGGIAILALLATLLALALLGLEAPPAALDLPLGPPDHGLRVVLDPVAAVLLALVLAPGAIAA
ncbi:MAG: hydrogenase 4 subunit B, partial [Rhodospirillales bacterium]|nr:hydrogenase 4 subunit B [Rhodospirillales bacterium]